MKKTPLHEIFTDLQSAETDIDRQLIESTLDHILVEMTQEERELYLALEPAGFLSVYYKAFFAALTEYVYSLSGNEPPCWVDNSEYSCDELVIPAGFLAWFEGIPEEQWKQEMIDASLPAFIKRNIVMTANDVLCAV
jgi:hypothetical protein